MIVAFVTEDESDSRVLSVALEQLLETPIEPHHYLLQRGFGAVLKSASTLATLAARAKTPLICVIVDCDETEDHYRQHDPLDCRFCRLNELLPEDHTLSALALGQSRCVLGLAVRTLETWLAIAGGLSVPGDIHELGRSTQGRRSLKTIVYGNPNPRREVLIERGTSLLNVEGSVARLSATSASFRHFSAQVMGQRSRTSKLP